MDWERETGERVRRLIERREGRKRADLVLARLLGVSRSSAFERLSGRTRWKAREVALLAERFGVPPGELLGMKEETGDVEECREDVWLPAGPGDELVLGPEGEWEEGETVAVELAGRIVVGRAAPDGDGVYIEDALGRKTLVPPGKRVRKVKAVRFRKKPATRGPAESS